MRFMLVVRMSTEQASLAVREGRIGDALQRTMERLRPEAAYFGPIEGKRGGFVVINMEEGSDVVTKLERLWPELGATIELFPVATPDELRAGLRSL